MKRSTSVVCAHCGSVMCRLRSEGGSLSISLAGFAARYPSRLSQLDLSPSSCLGGNSVQGERVLHEVSASRYSAFHEWLERRGALRVSERSEGGEFGCGIERRTILRRGNGDFFRFTCWVEREKRWGMERVK